MSHSPPRPRVTMADVARTAGLSRATVSKYFNGDGRLRPATRTRIEAACAALDYVPDLHAAALARGRAPLIGVIVPVIEESFFGRLLTALDAAARGRGHRLLIQCSQADPALEATLLADMLSLNVAGLLVTPTAREGEDQALRRAARQTRLVYLDYPAAAAGACVMTDHQAGIAAATGHMIARGAAPYYLSLPDINRVCAERRAGYGRAMRTAGLAPRWVPTDAGIPGWDFAGFGYDALQAWLTDRQNVTRLRAAKGLVCANDRLALGAYRALREVGLTPGETVWVSGHDDLALCRYLDPPLTSYRQDLAAIGRAAVAALLDAPPAGTLRLPGTLMGRGSA